MAMSMPKIGKAYAFVRRQGQALEYTEFTRFSDGSGCVAEGGCIHGNDKLGAMPWLTSRPWASKSFERPKRVDLFPTTDRQAMAWRPDAQG